MKWLSLVAPPTGANERATMPATVAADDGGDDGNHNSAASLVGLNDELVFDRAGLALHLGAE